MGTISSGVGLVSGLNLQALIDQMIAIEARPRDMLLTRVGKINAQRAAFGDISARLSGVLARLGALKKTDTFLNAKGVSSNPAVLSAQVGGSAAVGSYSFTVRSLATTHQLVTRSFGSATTALPPGTLTLESAAARVDQATRLDDLRGGAGIQRGKFKLTDGADKSATIDISDALTLSEVQQRINDAGLNITASIRDDRLVIRELSGGELKIAEVGGGRAAADLGFPGEGPVSAEGELVGESLVYLATDTPLSQLNDGLGLRLPKAGAAFKINDIAIDLSDTLTPETPLARLNHGAGVQLGKIRITTQTPNNGKLEREIDLTGSKTIGDVQKKLEEAAPDLSVTLNGQRLIVSYKDGSKDKTISIADVSGKAAAGLGIDGTGEAGKISGRNVLVVDRVADILAAINAAPGNAGAFTASIGDVGIKITSSAGPLTISATGAAGEQTLRDLGLSSGAGKAEIQGGRIIGGVNSVLLKSLDGGAGITAGVVQIKTGDKLLSVDLTEADTLEAALGKLRSAFDENDVDLTVGYDNTGTRLLLRDPAGGTVTVSDATGDFALKTGLSETAGSSLRGANLQRRYISENTLLRDLNQGRGISVGTFEIVTASGSKAKVTVPGGATATLADMIDEINRTNIGVTARINDLGDGIIVEDASTGSGKLRITDLNGVAARDLAIAGESTDRKLDGSAEVHIELSGSQTLTDLAALINSRGKLGQASILTTGGAGQVRLTLQSLASGAAGEVLLDDTGLDLDASVMTAAADAVVRVGGDLGGVLITSSTNTLTHVAPGISLTLLGTSAEPVSVNVTQDSEAAVKAARELVDALNAGLSRMKKLSSYNSETEERGVLLGDASLSTAESRLLRTITGRFPVGGQFDRLSQVGIRLDGGEFKLDEQKLRDALVEDRDSVVKLFTAKEAGVGAVVEKSIKDLTESAGLIDRRDESLDRQRTLLTERVTRLNELLDLKRARLSREFLAMENALARLQAQQGSLSQLASVAASFGKGS